MTVVLADGIAGGASNWGETQWRGNCKELGLGSETSCRSTTATGEKVADSCISLKQNVYFCSFGLQF